VTDIGNVISFPRQLRVVPFRDAEPETVPGEPPAVVDHDGRSYPLEALLRGLTQDELWIVDQSAPRSGQELWDEVVRRWPALAEEIVAEMPQADIDREW
jgi:hypothetical protein